jgi:hypothetical protein
MAIVKKVIPLSEKQQTVKIKHRQRLDIIKIGIKEKCQYVWQVLDIILETYKNRGKK